MPWELIPINEIPTWNEKLKATKAFFYQFPYYVSSEYNSALAKAIFIKYVEGKQDIAYAAIIEIGIFPFNVGIIESGPELLVENVNANTLIAELKRFARKRSYMHLQIRPPIHSPLNEFFKNDKNFDQRVYFPYHLKDEFDLNIFNKPEAELLAGFKMQCRRKIVLAGRVDYKFGKADEKALADIKALFDEVADEKNYGFLPFKVYEAIYKEGKKYNLCDWYTVYLNNNLVNAALVVKDAQSYYHYTSALVVKGYHHNESPPAKLHFNIMKDCFYEENKAFYNISFGGSDNLIRFKELFNPVENERLPYYTFVIRKNTLKILSSLSTKYAATLRVIIKSIDRLFQPKPKAK